MEHFNYELWISSESCIVYYFDSAIKERIFIVGKSICHY